MSKSRVLLLSVSLVLHAGLALDARAEQQNSFKCKDDGFAFACGTYGECYRIAEDHICKVHGQCGSGGATNRFTSTTIDPPKSLGQAFARGGGVFGGLGALLGSLNYKEDPQYIAVGAAAGFGAGMAFTTLMNAEQMTPAAAALALGVAGAAGGYAYSQYRVLEGYEDTRPRDTLIGAVAGAAIGIPLALSNRSPVSRPHSGAPVRRVHFIAAARFAGVSVRW